MRKFATLLTAAVATATLVGTAAATAPATAAGDVASAHQAAAKKKKPKIKVSTDKPGSHYGQVGVKVTAKTKAKKGKVTFTVKGTDIKAKKKIKKHKAKFTVPAGLNPGKYKVVAKAKGAKGSTKFEVYNSSLTLNAVTFTVSQAGYCTADPVMNGTVLFKGKNPSEGYVDIYKDGNIKGGSSSPDFVTFDSVKPGGAFEFGTCDSLWSEIKDYGPGTYQFKALYTPTASYAEYIYSSWITVTVVP